MAVKEVKLTFEGLKRLEKELSSLKGHARMEVAERIKEAISFGDISENSEYDDAKNDQARLESRIMQLEQMLSNATIIDEDEIKTDEVSIGAKVTVYDAEYDEEVSYVIVGSTEANPLESKISDESPVGKELIGKKVGDVAEVTTLDGTITFKIISIQR